jgi:hypothetical protein
MRGTFGAVCAEAPGGPETGIAPGVLGSFLDGLLRGLLKTSRNCEVVKQPSCREKAALKVLGGQVCQQPIEALNVTVAG